MPVEIKAGCIPLYYPPRLSRPSLQFFIIFQSSLENNCNQLLKQYYKEKDGITFETVGLEKSVPLRSGLKCL